MYTGGLAQMTSNNFVSPVGHGMPGGLAARRGGQNIKPLSFDAIKQGNANQDGGVPTPRTSRSHLLAGLRTAPKTAAAASFGPMSPTGVDSPVHHYARNSINGNVYGYGQTNAYNPPKTAYPQYGQQSGYHAMMSQQQYTVDQVLAPPQLSMDEQAQEQMDPSLYAQLVATNAYLAQQQQRLQQQLMTVQAAAQKFQQYNINTPQQLAQQQQLALLEQQQLQVQQAQQAQLAQAAMAQGQQVYYNPLTGQYYVDTSAVSQMNNAYSEQPMTPGFNGFQQQQQQLHHQQQQQQGTPRVQVSPPPETQQVFRSDSPPKRFDSPPEVAPLPPPSANAFRRHKKSASSLAPLNSALAAVTINDSVKSPAPKTASFPLTPATGGYGPGQARAGEHPIRQPRGPPNWDELKDKPTAKFEGSKNFVTRTRRSAVHNLVRAHMERRKGSSSSGSMTPVSETGDDSVSPITDNDSDSGRSGSGSLAGEEESLSSRTSASGSWGAIGSDRPSSRQKARNSVDSTASGNEPTDGSFADVFKNGALRATKAQEAASSQRKASRLVLTSVEKRKTATGA